MKTCTLVICLLLSALGVYATAPADGDAGTASKVAAVAEPFTICLEAENANSDAPVSGDPNASNGEARGAQNTWDYFVEYQTDVPTAGKYLITLRYNAEQDSPVNVSINAGTSTQIVLPASYSWNIAWKEHTFEVDLPAGNNRIRIKELPGYNVRQDKVCWTENGPSDPVCEFEIAPSTAARYELGDDMAFFANCSGANCDEVTFTWTGNGILRYGNIIGLKTPSVPGTYTYDLFATKSGCSNKTGSVTVEVVITPGCDYNVSASVSNATPQCSEPITLSAQCTGPDCDGVRYSWGGGGLNVSGQSITVPAPPGKRNIQLFPFCKQRRL
ncbi:hypothetical protein [Dyadobacter sp. 676]|uniref:CBM6 domain-containing protein n=1 Tax=Dyadobacter sp. 676 TaxID=3088362 RepID=A0AAU8FIC5_9BACT